MSAVDHERLAASSSTAAAAKHRQEAGRLRALEASACGGFSLGERSSNPLADAGWVVEVEHIVSQPRRSGPIPSGVVILMRPHRGITVETLTRRIDCHREWRAVVGEVPADARDPVVARGTYVHVGAAGANLVVTVRTAKGAGGVVVARTLDLIESLQRR